MSKGFNITVDTASLGEAVAVMQLLKSNLQVQGCASMTKAVAKTKETFADETVKTLKVDFERVDGEIETTAPDTDTLDGFSARIVSTGKPIEMIDFATDAAGWKRKSPVHVQIFRGRTIHEFRHVSVKNNQIYGWSKYVPGQKAKRTILSSVRIQDIQAQPYFIDPIIEGGAEAVIDNFTTAADEILANV